VLVADLPAVDNRNRAQHVRERRMSCVECGDDVWVGMMLGAGEEVGQDVLLPWAMPSANGDVVLQGEGVDSPKKPSEALAAGRLLVEYMHVAHIVHEEQHAGITEYVGVRGEGGEHNEHFAPGHLPGGGVEVSVLRRIHTHKAGPDTQVGRPLRNIGGRWYGLKVETEAAQARV
jgi:hypothetical protein